MRSDGHTHQPGPLSSTPAAVILALVALIVLVGILHRASVRALDDEAD